MDWQALATVAIINAPALAVAVATLANSFRNTRKLDAGEQRIKVVHEIVTALHPEVAKAIEAIQAEGVKAAVRGELAKT